VHPSFARQLANPQSSGDVVLMEEITIQPESVQNIPTVDSQVNGEL
jgi:hypothetical protein